MEEPSPLAGVKLAIVGCARNVAALLPETLRNAERIGAMFASCQYVFVESDSDDDTYRVLCDFANAHPKTCRVVSLGRLRDTLPLRTQRLAEARNCLLSACRKMYAEGAATHMLMLDLDEEGHRNYSREAVTSCFRHHGWAAMSSSDTRYYYDIWALRRPGGLDWDYQRVWKGVEWYEWCKRSALPRDAPLVPVRSAFQGATFYDLAWIKPWHAYVGLYPREPGQDHDIEICEHVPFHEQIVADGGRIFINPAFARTYPDEH